MLRPHTKSLPMLGLGGSIATPRRGIIASVLVVKSFDELKQKAQEVSMLYKLVFCIVYLMLVISSHVTLLYIVCTG